MRKLFRKSSTVDIEISADLINDLDTEAYLSQVFASADETLDNFDPERYLDEKTEQHGLAGLAPDAIAERLDELPVRLGGPAYSRLGGRIAKDLKLPSDAERTALHRAADDLGARPVRSFPE